jgi:hypothetical protein
MKISDHAQGKKLTLSHALDSRAKMLNVFYFIAFTAGAWILSDNIADSDIGVPLFILFALFAAFYCIAAYRFINKALMSETLMIDHSNLQLINSGFFSKKIRSYNPLLIRQLFYLERKELTRHPLAGESFDYLGFQTQQQMINELHGDNKVSFDYEGKTVSFGENIYSWDFEEIEKIFKEYTGAEFRFNEEFEKVFKFDDDGDMLSGIQSAG